MMRPDMNNGAAAAAAAATVGTSAPGKTTTEEQARAITCAAQRAVEEAKRGGAEGMSLKKSLEWFLEGRKNKAAMAAGETQRHIIDDSCSSSYPSRTSSSSVSALVRRGLTHAAISARMPRALTHMAMRPRMPASASSSSGAVAMAGIKQLNRAASIRRRGVRFSSEEARFGYGVVRFNRSGPDFVGADSNRRHKTRFGDGEFVFVLVLRSSRCCPLARLQDEDEEDCCCCSGGFLWRLLLIVVLRPKVDEGERQPAAR
ncbi:hypothetical protein HU200_059212 [Digitaria exilis]|uniref:Uncharacterized protein n=1 Tax=Digitaria exilis TaxID=1010633 RepID=A0A835ACJ4_9POAL|nr:hypothetical protein HU200_059212 [Digitaria exilis]